MGTKQDQEQRLSLMTAEEQVEELAACNYTPSEIARYINMSRRDFLTQLATEDSKIAMAYYRGKMEVEYKIDAAQKNKAAEGNTTSAQIYERKREAKKIQEIKERIWFHEELP